MPTSRLAGGKTHGARGSPYQNTHPDPGDPGRAPVIGQNDPSPPRCGGGQQTQVRAITQEAGDGWLVTRSGFLAPTVG